MKASVDQDLCIGCELCVEICPAVFKMADGAAYVYTNPLPSENENEAKKAADDCPVSCIFIE